VSAAALDSSLEQRISLLSGTVSHYQIIHLFSRPIATPCSRLC